MNHHPSYWLVTLSAAFCLAATVHSCTKKQVQTVHDVVDAACILIPYTTNDGTPGEVCATMDELAPVASAIVIRRAVKNPVVDASADRD